MALLRHLITQHGWELKDLLRLAEENRFHFLHEATHRSRQAQHDHPRLAPPGG